ncbi:unnamed protein product [Thelazia callipaeda]|uniref:Uncharacterized protein n=1 Tax=Thelazia callipaeda TaxID=103827 RepID=A0A0N5D0G2_THECL|nr:unnamed protein product [Thelazia callipaeda]
MNPLNPVDIWKKSSWSDQDSYTTSNAGTKSLFLTAPVISSFAGDANYLRRVFKAWPIATEKKAVFWPAHATLIACGFTGIITGIRVNSYTFLGDPNCAYTESLRKCPRLTWIISLYTSALVYFGLNENIVRRYLYSHGTLCNTCLILSSTVTALACGIALPMLSTPYLTAAAAILQGDKDAIPPIRKSRNWLNYLFRWKIGINACRGVLLPMSFGLATVAGFSMYIRLWGRKKILDTLSVEPEFVSEIAES